MIGASGSGNSLIPTTASFALSKMSVPDGRGAGHMASRRADRQIAGPEHSVRRRRAVILDHDPNLLEILRELLADEDYDVTLSTNFLEKDEVDRLDPSVIIADAEFIQGPDEQSLYGEPLQRPDGTLVPIIYCTTEPEIVARFLDRDVPILLKPFDLDALLALVSRDDD